MGPRIILITDSAFGDEVLLRCVRTLGASLPRGAFGVQLRDKRRALTSLRLFAAQLRRTTTNVGASFWVNGHAEIARDVDADGVHLGTDAARTVADVRAILGRRKWVSVAAHTDADVKRAHDDGADAVLVSPIFATRAPTRGLSAEPQRAKPMRGVAAIRSARSLAPSPMRVYALGGITPERVRMCAIAGADGIALIRGLLASAEPGRTARAIHDALAARW
jgi:thiamine-phosphate pyrophosphorylase